nr:HEAT repeat domain-containing protein [uncultured Arsenicibacter sp.]
MNCEQANERLTGWLSDQISDAERQAIDSHLAACPGCQREYQQNQQLWQLMGDLPVPAASTAMRSNFYTMLETYKDTVSSEKQAAPSGWLEKLKALWPAQPAFQLAYSLCVLAVGILAGFWFSQRQTPAVAYQQQIDTLSNQVQQMRQMMMLSLLDNPSASERLRAVSYTKEISDANRQVTDALLTTLNNDPNVNVRLVTLEALVQYADDPHVREGLVQSLPRQESPMVQVAMADVMAKLQEKRAIKGFRKMLKQDGLNDLVKTKIEQTIRDLS